MAQGKEENRIRLLRAKEIECRLATANEKGICIVLYKSARVDMAILDEVYGPMGWQRKHEMIGGSLYCTVSIFDSAKKEWVSKMDVGTESSAEKEKGQASDAFKRACVSVGIGRELYTAPFIWIGADKARLEKKQDNHGDRWSCRDTFRVRDITYNEDREIIGLVIINQDGRTVYEMRPMDTGMARQHPEGDTQPAGTVPARRNDDKAAAINKELQRTGIALSTVLSRYGVSDVQEMSEAVYQNALGSLKKTKTRVA